MSSQADLALKSEVEKKPRGRPPSFKEKGLMRTRRRAKRSVSSDDADEYERAEDVSITSSSFNEEDVLS